MPAVIAFFRVRTVEIINQRSFNPLCRTAGERVGEVLLFHIGKAYITDRLIEAGIVAKTVS